MSLPTADRVSLDPAALDALRHTVRGAVLAPGDTDYETSRRAWNTTVDQHPAVIVDAAASDDVVAAVRFAHAGGLPVAVQSTGHGVAYPADAALLIRTSRMTTVAIDPHARLVRAEAGVLWHDVLKRAQAFDLAPLSGFAPYIGVTGYTLGGGVGWLLRKYGLAVDSLRAVELVTVDGTVVRASNDQHSDLFWGLCGGGGNFGVVTALEFALYPVATVYGGSLFYPLDRAGAVLHQYSAWAATVPDECTSAVAIMQLPSDPHLPEAIRGRSVIAVRACFLGSEHDGAALLLPLRALVPLLDTVAPLPYADSGTIAGDPVEPLGSFGHGELLSALSPRAIDSLIAAASEAVSAAPIAIELRQLGGAMARVSADANAISHRHAPFLLHTAGLISAPAEVAHVRTVTQAVVAAMRPYTTGGALLNFLGDGDVGDDRTRAVYSAAHYRRLVALKDRYDPQNMFRFNINIRPSGGA